VALVAAAGIRRQLVEAERVLDQVNDEQKGHEAEGDEEGADRDRLKVGVLRGKGGAGQPREGDDGERDRDGDSL